MNALNLIAGLAFACLATGTYAQSCAGHAHAKGGESHADMASIAKELSLTAEQQTAFTTALASCEKDCSAMASTGTTGEDLFTKKQTRFNTALASMKDVLKPDQYKKLEEMNNSGKLAGLCGPGASGKGCGAGKAGASKGCCAGKAGAHAEQRTAPKANADATPTIQ